MYILISGRRVGLTTPFTCPLISTSCRPAAVDRNEMLALKRLPALFQVSADTACCFQGPSQGVHHAACRSNALFYRPITVSIGVLFPPTLQRKRTPIEKQQLFMHTYEVYTCIIPRNNYVPTAEKKEHFLGKHRTTRFHAVATINKRVRTQVVDIRKNVEHHAINRAL